MIHIIILLSIIGIDVLVLLFQITTISISSHEANILYGDFSFIQLVEKITLFLFGYSDFALRLPMITFHILSVLLLYSISKQYLQDNRNRIWLVSVFILLPGVLSSALLVDSAGFIIFGLLLFIYVYDRFSIKYSYLLLLLFSLLDGAFVYLFLSLIFYSWYKKNRDFLLLNIFLFITSIVIHGIKISGVPKGHLLDTIGLYSAVFTPIIFIYIFYILYRKFLSREINIVWFISTVPLLVSLLLSFRQEIYINDFAPYFIVALPLAAQTFYASYRVRLKMFRGKYKTIFILSAIFLLINFFVVIFNRELYIVIDNPKKHFARKMHIAKELAKELKKRDIKCVKTNSDMAKRLKFYGIENCEHNLLVEKALDYADEKELVTIGYKYRPIYKATVTNVNSK